MDAPDTRDVEWSATAVRFATTHWSMVLSARPGGSAQATEALEQLCRTYWYPIYAYVRRQGHSASDAQDLTQGFFARLVNSHFFADADRAKGRFRSFLLGALTHFLHEQWRRAGRIKRGGRLSFLSLDEPSPEDRYRLEPVDEMTPEKSFARRWAVALLDQVVGRLRAEFTAAGKASQFAILQPCLLGDKGAPSCAELAARLGKSAGAVKVAVHRMRQRYGELLREEIAHTVARPEEIEEEINYLLAALSS